MLGGHSIMLRKVTECDLPIVFEHQRDPEASRMAAFLPRDPSDWEAFIAHWRRILRDDAVIMRAVIFEGRVCGTVGSFLWDGKPQVAYWIGKEFWGKGIATAALKEFLRMVAERPLYANAAKDNVASIRVLEKCGFTMVGSAKAFAEARGREIEEVFFGLGG
jgi:RimJ/RimL family protein N-acetyltransferase